MKLLVTAESPPEEKPPIIRFASASITTETMSLPKIPKAHIDAAAFAIDAAAEADSSSNPQSSALSGSPSGIATGRHDGAGDALLAGADDKIFRVDRAELRECAELVIDRQKLATLRHKW